LGSTRYPGKILSRIDEKNSILGAVYRRTLLCKEATRENTYVLTTTSPKDDLLANVLDEERIKYFRGDEFDVYNRFYAFFQHLISTNYRLPKYFIRICSDNPFIDYMSIDKMITFSDKEYDYVSYYDYREMIPSIRTHFGIYAEMVRITTFIESVKLIDTVYKKEHVTPEFYESQRYSTKYIPIPKNIENSNIRLTVDSKQDFNNIRNIVKQAQTVLLSTDAILEILTNNKLLLTSMSQEKSKYDK
jgi:spore coat polysaccharide biosynthesis protein SpsF (cytidylyltransferase family)